MKKWSVMMKEFESQSHLMLLFSLFGLFVFICLILLFLLWRMAADFFNLKSPLWSYTVGSSVVLVEAVFEASWLQVLVAKSATSSCNFFTSTPTPIPTSSNLQQTLLLLYRYVPGTPWTSSSQPFTLACYSHSTLKWDEVRVPILVVCIPLCLKKWGLILPEE